MERKPEAGFQRLPTKVVTMKKNLVRNIGLLSLMGGIVLGLAGCPFGPNKVVYVPDAALQSAIRSAIDKPFGLLTEEDLLDVKELEAPGLDIRNLEGLEYCRFLTRANFRSNKIQSITPVSGLTFLTWLDLGDNLVRDIEPLSGLFALEYVNLFGDFMEIWDWSPLVANAQAGGLGSGDTIVLPTGTTLDAENDDAILDYWLEDYLALVASGVTIIFADPTETQVEF